MASEESDKIIHAYGIFVNRDPDNYSKYSKYGVIRSCIFDYVAGITNAENRAEGEGIFIQ